MKCKFSVEQQVLIFAGIMLNLFVILSYVWGGFIFFVNLIGIMLIVYAITGVCPAQIVLKKMPWNK